MTRPSLGLELGVDDFVLLILAFLLFCQHYVVPRRYHRTARHGRPVCLDLEPFTRRPALSLSHDIKLDTSRFLVTALTSFTSHVIRVESEVLPTN